MRTTSRGWWLALLVGVVALAVGITLLVTSRRLPPAFSAAVAVSGTASATPSGSVAAVSPSGSTASAPPSAVAPVAPTAAPPFRPAAVTLAAFGVTAPVDPVLTVGGVLDPPADPSRVGWWGAGELAGAEAGATVVVGHVDGPAGPGALYRLVHAQAGDRIIVAGSNGQAVTYVVTSLAYHVKGSDLPTSLFTADGPPRLVIISCGGTFDRGDDQYADNVVVQAARA